MKVDEFLDFLGIPENACANGDDSGIILLLQIDTDIANGFGAKLCDTLAFANHIRNIFASTLSLCYELDRCNEVCFSVAQKDQKEPDRR